MHKKCSFRLQTSDSCLKCIIPITNHQQWGIRLLGTDDLPRKKYTHTHSKQETNRCFLFAIFWVYSSSSLYWVDVDYDCSLFDVNFKFLDDSRKMENLFKYQINKFPSFFHWWKSISPLTFPLSTFGPLKCDSKKKSHRREDKSHRREWLQTNFKMKNDVTPKTQAANMNTFKIIMRIVKLERLEVTKVSADHKNILFAIICSVWIDS